MFTLNFFVATHLLLVSNIFCLFLKFQELEKQKRMVGTLRKRNADLKHALQQRDEIIQVFIINIKLLTVLKCV